VQNVQVIDNSPLTDHDAVQFMFNVLVPPQLHRKRMLYNYKQADLSLLRETLSHVPWNIIEGTSDIEGGNCLKTCFYLMLLFLFLILSGERRKLSTGFLMKQFT